MIPLSNFLNLSFRFFAVFSLEKSSDQVTEPIYSHSLYKWMDTMPKTISQDTIDNIAPVLKKLGYDTSGQKPDYVKMKENIE